jgi:hypothetical protein
LAVVSGKASINEYLQDVLQRLPDQPINQLKELLPPLWKPVNLTQHPYRKYNRLFDPTDTTYSD